jgi:hypothetical protein
MLLAKTDGALFCVQIVPENELFSLHCYARIKDTHGNIVQSVYDDLSPPGPLNTEVDARRLAIEIASVRGYTPDEIVWEALQSLP